MQGPKEHVETHSHKNSIGNWEPNNRSMGCCREAEKETLKCKFFTIRLGPMHCCCPCGRLLGWLTVSFIPLAIHSLFAPHGRLSIHASIICVWPVFTWNRYTDDCSSVHTSRRLSVPTADNCEMFYFSRVFVFFFAFDNLKQLWPNARSHSVCFW